MIIPSVAGGARLRRALDSLAAQEVEHEVVVIDNGSAAGAVSRACRDHGVEMVSLERNVGFSRAVNLGARRAAGEVILIVNDDCVFDPGFVEAIAAALDPGRGVGMAAGVMRDRRHPGLIDTAGIVLDRTLLAFDYLNGEPIATLNGAIEAPVGPSGAAAAFDRAAFWEAGGFDERLFAYLEDVDLALRLQRIGCSCALASAARGTHEHSATLGSGSTRKNYLMGFGRGYLLRKWGVLRDPRRIAAALAQDVVVCAGQAVVDRNFSGVAGRARGYLSTRRAEPFPDRALVSSGPGPVGSMRRRARRRARLRRANPPRSLPG